MFEGIALRSEVCGDERAERRSHWEMEMVADGAPRLRRSISSPVSGRRGVGIELACFSLPSFGVPLPWLLPETLLGREPSTPLSTTRTVNEKVRRE